jgi:hypothetical protein
VAATMKILAQAYPSAATSTALYTVGAGKSAVISTIAVCNTTGSQLTFRIATVPSGGTLGSASYIAYDSKVTGNDTNFITVGITLEAGATIYVYNATQGVAYNLYGTELA